MNCVFGNTSGDANGNASGDAYTHGQIRGECPYPIQEFTGVEITSSLNSHSGRSNRQSQIKTTRMKKENEQ
jgi:hypothetical protein